MGTGRAGKAVVFLQMPPVWHTSGELHAAGMHVLAACKPSRSALTHAGALGGRQEEHLIAGAAARSALAAIAPVAGDARRAAAVRIRVEVRPAKDLWTPFKK